MSLRMPAEWEKQLCTIIAMPHKDSDWKSYLAEAQATIDEIIAQISRFQSVVVLYKFESDVVKWRDKKNVICAHIETNDTWCRDFMPLSLKNKNRKVVLLDFVFNAWGGKFAFNLDNLASKKLFESGAFKALKSDIKFRSKNFILEGGSIDCNGAGVILTTQKCLLSANRNNLSEAKITKKLKKYLHLNSVLWLKNGALVGDDTDSHIDNLARFVGKNTIVYLRCEDKNSPNFRELMAMERELKALKNAQNKPFKLIALPMPSLGKSRLPASYVNFVLVNGAVLVPIFETKSDQIALNAFGKIFPNREIIGIDSRVLIRQGGSLHCLTMNVPMQ